MNKRVCSVCVGRFGQAEQGPDHERDLIFFSAAPPNRSLFDSRGRIFENRQPIFSGGQNGSTPRRAEQNRRLVTLDVNDRFKRATIRFVFEDQLRELIADRDQTRR